MTTTEYLIIAAIILGFVALFLLFRALQKPKIPAETRSAESPAPARPLETPPPAPAPTPAAPAEPAEAIIETPAVAPSTAPAADSPSPTFLSAPDGPADDLSKIKGIGPKLSARLAELGVFHFRQIAQWTPAQLAEVDAQLGNFAGRPMRDQWQSQARLLADGDVKAYERAHGKLGPSA